MVKTIHWISHAKKNRSGKNGDKDGSVLQINKKHFYGKTIENLRNSIDIRLVNNKKNRFKMYIKTKLNVAQNIWQ